MSGFGPGRWDFGPRGDREGSVTVWAGARLMGFESVDGVTLLDMIPKPSNNLCLGLGLGLGLGLACPEGLFCVVW